MTETITVNLFKSYGASFRHYTVDLNERKNPKDPLGPLARLLLKEGYGNETKVHVLRDGVPTFKNDHTLSYWAEHDYVDSQTRPAYRVKYRPYEHE